MPFNAPALVLPLYTRGPAEPSRLRRVAAVLAQIAVAAGYGFAAVALPPSMLFVLILPVVVCLLLALWMMPDRGVFPRTAIERWYGVLLVLMVAWPEYVAVVLPGLPWLTPTRMVTFVITFLFLYSISTSGLLRQHIGAVVRSSRLFWTAFVMWQASMFVSLPFSQIPAQSIKALSDRLLSNTELLFLGCLVFTRRGAANRTIGWLVALAVVCAFDGFVEVRMGYPPWALHIPSFMKIDDATLAGFLGSQARSADGLYRVRGPFGNSLIFAQFLALCTPFILHWMLTGRSLLLRASMPIVWGLVVYTIVVTQSRLGLVGTIVGVATYVPLWAYRQWRTNPTSIAGPTLLFGAPLVAVVLIGVVFSSHTMTMRVLGGGAQQSSNDARVVQRHLAVPKVLANPLGHGLNTTGAVLGFYNPLGQVTVDDDYIVTSIELGVMGLAGFVGMFAVAAWLGARQYLATGDRESALAGPLASTFIIFLVIESVLAEENNHPLAMLLLGMAMALRARELNLGVLDAGPDK